MDDVDYHLWSGDKGNQFLGIVSHIFICVARRESEMEFFVIGGHHPKLFKFRSINE